MAKSDSGSVILWTLGLLGVVVGGYFLVTKVIAPQKSSEKNGALSKEDEVVGILSSSGGQGCYNFLMSLDNNYIGSWYNAVKNRQPTFISGGGKFSTVTGKAV